MLRIGSSDTKKAKDCAKALDRTHILSPMNIRKNSIFSDAGDDRKAFENVNKWLLEKSVPFEAIEIVQPSLEDVFLKLTGTERG